MAYKLIILAILLFTASLCGATELKLPLLWAVNTNTLLESAPTLADLTGDGHCDVLAAGREEMIALDHNGKMLWRWRTQARYMTYPAVLSRKGQPALIYAADNGGLLTCLDGSGKVVWQAHLKTGSSWSSAVVCDLNHDGTFQVIQTDESGTIWAFDALTGKVRWQASMKGSPVSPAVGDVDGDGKDEIAVASTSGQLALFSSSGTLRWERTVSGASETWATSAPVIFGASDRHGRIAVGASDGHIRCFDSTGKRLWSRETRGSVASSLSVGDMDHAGRADIFAITQTGVIYRFDEDGREIWNIDMQGRTIAAGALIDLQNDGHLDFVTSTQSGHLMIFDSQGQMRFEHQFPNRTINMTPAFGDVTPTSPGLEMVINGGESGRIFCFGTPAAAAAPPSARPWVSYRGDNHKTGAWFGLAQAQAGGTIPRRPSRLPDIADQMQAQTGGMMPKDATWNHLVTGDPVVFTIHVPETQNLPLKATAVCVRPDGSLQSAITPVYGAQGELPLTLDIVQPGSYRFRWWVADSRGQKLAEGQHTVSLEPFARDRALVQQARGALTIVADRVAPTLPLAASGLRRETLLLEQQTREVEATQKELGKALGVRRWALGQTQESLPGADGSSGQAALRQTAALVRTARRDVGLASAVDAAAALGSGTSLVAFETTLWESGGVDAQLPTQAVNPLKLTRRVVPGEHDPISVKLLNVTNHELQVRVLVETPSDGPVVVPFRSVAVPTSQGGMSWDALAELDETCTLSIPAFATREVWLDARFDNVSPGAHSVKVRFQALNGAGVLDGPTGAQDVPAPETIVEVHYRVLPFAMVPDGAFRLCCWASCGPAEIADLLDHGNNVFCVPQAEPKYDAQGHLTGCDFTNLDKMLNLLRGHDVVALVQSKPELKPAEDSPQYAADLKTYLADLVAHFAKLGFDTDHFALYPYDEPGGNGWNAVNGLAAFGQQVKAANPKIKLYMDGGGELPMFQKVAPYIDIWCPGLGMLAEQSPEMNLIHDTQKALWSYDCGYGYTTAMRANLKDTNIVAEYRSAALFAVRWNATGIGFWCYNLGPDAWERMATDYPLVYPGKTKPVTSRRWEAVREGIEDARMLLALRQSEATIQDPALKERIRTLFEVRLPAFTDRSYHEVLVGLGRSAFSLSKNDAVLAAFRNEMLDCIEAVCREKTSTVTTAATRE